MWIKLLKPYKTYPADHTLLVLDSLASQLISDGAAEPTNDIPERPAISEESEEEVEASAQDDTAKKKAANKKAAPKKSSSKKAAPKKAT